MLESLHYTDAEGNVYVAQHTPYADYVLTYRSATTFEKGLVYHGECYDKRQVNEKIVDMALNEAQDSQPPEQNGVVINYGAYRDYVQCVINTEIKPQYQDQFKVQPRNP